MRHPAKFSNILGIKHFNNVVINSEIATQRYILKGATQPSVLLKIDSITLAFNINRMKVREKRSLCANKISL